MNFFARILDFLGFKAANLGSQACMCLILDEEAMPKSLLK